VPREPPVIYVRSLKQWARGFLHRHTAGNAPAAAAQRFRLIGIIITACVDHYRAALNVGHGKMWCCNRLRSFAAGINGKHWHIALVTLTLRPEVLASVSRVVMASRGHPSRWLGHLVRWRDRSSD
jgi:hypothetical protein